jgi:hypothetical protein
MKKPVPPRIEKFPAAKQRRLDQLLEKNSAGTIALTEKTKLLQLVVEAEALMIANARRLADFARSERKLVPAPAEPLKLGTLVKIRHSGFMPGPIVEYRGPLGPRGMRVYRIRIRKKPRPGYIEVCEDQLEMVEPGVIGTQS